jgi:stearoyl-CoA desaturase (delta-9 desaturase)
MTAQIDAPTTRERAAMEEPVKHTGLSMRLTIGAFIVVPLLAVVAAIPVAWGGWLGWVDLILAAVFYVITAMGVTIGYHRYFTHGSFKAPRWVTIFLATAGSLALEGSIDQWVANHRKHHKYSDEVGDPHSPWRFGTSRRAVAKGLYFAHMGWLVNDNNAPVDRYAPDIARDPYLRVLSRWFPAVVLTTLFLPALLGGLITWSWTGALTAFFWAGLVRIALVHHVTWSINSVCHVFGTRPFDSRDLSANVWWLAVPSLGESWHNLHHVEPTAARHGVLTRQFDLSAEILRVWERLGIIHDVRWPKPERIVAKLEDPSLAYRVRGYRPPVQSTP